MKKLEGRRLALMIGIAVSGAVLFPQYAAAADVTGHDIVSSRDWTGPDTNPRAAGYIGSADDNGNVYGNTLTVDSHIIRLTHWTKATSQPAIRKAAEIPTATVSSSCQAHI